jgi:hypothetical protein
LAILSVTVASREIKSRSSNPNIEIMLIYTPSLVRGQGNSQWIYSELFVFSIR